MSSSEHKEAGVAFQKSVSTRTRKEHLSLKAHLTLTGRLLASVINSRTPSDTDLLPQVQSVHETCSAVSRRHSCPPSPSAQSSASTSQPQPETSVLPQGCVEWRALDFSKAGGPQLDCPSLHLLCEAVRAAECAFMEIQLTDSRSDCPDQSSWAWGQGTLFLTSSWDDPCGKSELETANLVWCPCYRLEKRS